jgi:hypothetical protein
MDVVGLGNRAFPGVLERGPVHLVLFGRRFGFFSMVVGMNAKQNKGLSVHLLDQSAEFARFLFDGAEGAPEQQRDDLPAVTPYSSPVTSANASSSSHSPGNPSAWIFAGAPERSASTTARLTRSGCKPSACSARRSSTWMATAKTGATRFRSSTARHPSSACSRLRTKKSHPSGHGWGSGGVAEHDSGLIPLLTSFHHARGKNSERRLNRSRPSRPRLGD